MENCEGSCVDPGYLDVFHGLSSFCGFVGFHPTNHYLELITPLVIKVPFFFSEISENFLWKIPYKNPYLVYPPYEFPPVVRIHVPKPFSYFRGGPFNNRRCLLP